MQNWKKAAEYLYLAPTLNAREAAEWGLVNRVVPRERLEDEVEGVAAQIAQMPLTTILVIKQGLKRAFEQQGMRLHLQGSTDLLTIATGASDVRAFMESRAGTEAAPEGRVPGRGGPPEALSRWTSHGRPRWRSSGGSSAPGCPPT